MMIGNVNQPRAPRDFTLHPLIYSLLEIDLSLNMVVFQCDQ
jgi:hypothetical protein